MRSSTGWERSSKKQTSDYRRPSRGLTHQLNDKCNKFALSIPLTGLLSMTLGHYIVQGGKGSKDHILQSALAVKMLSRHHQLSDDTDSSYSGTTLRSNDSETIDLASSDYESEDRLSETSADRAFVVSDTDALSYNSDNSSIGGEVSCGLEEDILEESEYVSYFMHNMKSFL
jgi:hypothetical protein